MAIWARKRRLQDVKEKLFKEDAACPLSTCLFSLLRVSAEKPFLELCNDDPDKELASQTTGQPQEE